MKSSRREFLHQAAAAGALAAISGLPAAAKPVSGFDYINDLVPIPAELTYPFSRLMIDFDVPADPRDRHFKDELHENVHAILRDGVIRLHPKEGRGELTFSSIWGAKHGLEHVLRSQHRVSVLAEAYRNTLPEHEGLNLEPDLAVPLLELNRVVRWCPTELRSTLCTGDTPEEKLALLTRVSGGAGRFTFDAHRVHPDRYAEFTFGSACEFYPEMSGEPYFNPARVVSCHANWVNTLADFEAKHGYKPTTLRISSVDVKEIAKWIPGEVSEEGVREEGQDVDVWHWDKYYEHLADAFFREYGVSLYVVPWQQPFTSFSESLGMLVPTVGDNRLALFGRA